MYVCTKTHNYSFRSYYYNATQILNFKVLFNTFVGKLSRQCTLLCEIKLNCLFERFNKACSFDKQIEREK